MLERKFTARLPPDLDYTHLWSDYSDRKGEPPFCKAGIVINSVTVVKRRINKYESRGFQLVKCESFEERLASLKSEYNAAKRRHEQYVAEITDLHNQRERNEKASSEICRRASRCLAKVKQYEALIEQLSYPVKESLVQ